MDGFHRLIAIRSAINYEDDQVFCTKSCNGQVFGHFSVALSYATHPYCTRVVKILLFQNAPGQTPVSQIAKLSAKAKGQEKRYIVSMSGANLSFLLLESSNQVQRLAVVGFVRRSVP